jgi:hypothetical protein
MLPCSLVEIGRYFTGAYCFCHQEAVRYSEKPINIYKTTWRNTPEGSHFHTRRREKPKISPTDITLDFFTFVKYTLYRKHFNQSCVKN